MARNRIIKPDFWADEKIGKLSNDAKLLYIGMWNFADDDGRIRYNPTYLRSSVFPYSNITIRKVGELLNELSEFIQPYSVNGQEYAVLKNFHKHQKINRPQESRLPKPPPFIDDSVNPHGTITEDSCTNVNVNVNVNEKVNVNGGDSDELLAIKKIPDCESIKITHTEFNNLVQQTGNEQTALDYLKRVHIHKKSTGASYINDYYTALGWYERDVRDGKVVTKKEHDKRKTCRKCKEQSPVIISGLCKKCYNEYLIGGKY